MREVLRALKIIIMSALGLCGNDAFASSAPISPARLAGAYDIIPDVTYLEADGVELKLDVYSPKLPYDGSDPDVNDPRVKPPVPTVIYFHGGGWVLGDKDEDALQFLPYLAKGWAVVNVEYRLAKVALAPAAVEDARCAVRWVIANAGRYGFDKDNLIVTGRSAGGHLALMAGMLPTSAGLDRRCPGWAKERSPRASADLSDIRVKAIVNWSGIADVNMLLEGKEAKFYAVAWLGSLPNRDRNAKRVSPITYVRSDLPPVLTIHGDADQVVPFSQAVRLHHELTRASVPNQLYTIPGKHHFYDYSAEDLDQAFAAIEEFLDQDAVTRGLEHSD